MWDILIVKCRKIPNRAHYMGCIGCLKGEVESSPTWVIVLFGNILRGIGEAGIGPLGMSFIDDYARPGNSAFYIGEKINIIFIFSSPIKITHVPSCDLVHFVLLLFSVGCLHTFGVIGPIFGYSLGSLCASLYVDIGLVDQGELKLVYCQIKIGIHPS